MYPARSFLSHRCERQGDKWSMRVQPGLSQKTLKVNMYLGEVEHSSQEFDKYYFTVISTIDFQAMI